MKSSVKESDSYQQDYRKLEERVTNLEKDKPGSKWRFFFQYLLSPILVVAIGIIFNFQIEKGRKELEQLKIAQSMLATLFSEDKYKTLATKRLMDAVLQSEALKQSIGRIVEDYLSVKFNQSIQNNDIESAKDILDAAKTMGGTVGENIAKKIETDAGSKAVLTQYQRAREKELEGFKALIHKDFNIALEKFKEAYSIYKDLHSVSEIYHLLDSNKNNFDDSEVHRKIYKEIIEKYSWKVPNDIISALKSKTN